MTKAKNKQAEVFYLNPDEDLKRAQEILASLPEAPQAFVEKVESIEFRLKPLKNLVKQPISTHKGTRSVLVEEHLSVKGLRWDGPLLNSDQRYSPFTRIAQLIMEIGGFALAAPPLANKLGLTPARVRVFEVFVGPSLRRILLTGQPPATEKVGHSFQRTSFVLHEENLQRLLSEIQKDAVRHKFGVCIAGSRENPGPRPPVPLTSCRDSSVFFGNSFDPQGSDDYLSEHLAYYGGFPVPNQGVLEGESWLRTYRPDIENFRRQAIIKKAQSTGSIEAVAMGTLVSLWEKTPISKGRVCALDSLIELLACGEGLDIGYENVFERAEVKLWTLFEARDATMGGASLKALGALVGKLHFETLAEAASFALEGSLESWNARNIKRAWRETVEPLVTKALT